MFPRWGRLVYRFRKPILLLSVLLAVAAAPLAGRASGALSTGGWINPRSESSQVVTGSTANSGAAAAT